MKEELKFRLFRGFFGFYLPQRKQIHTQLLQHLLSAPEEDKYGTEILSVCRRCLTTKKRQTQQVSPGSSKEAVIHYRRDSAPAVTAALRSFVHQRLSVHNHVSLKWRKQPHYCGSGGRELYEDPKQKKKGK